MRAALEILDGIAGALEHAGGGGTAVAAGADGDDRLFAGKDVELVLEARERHVLRSADVSVTPFGRLPHVEDVNCVVGEPLREGGGIGAVDSGEEAHDSGASGAFDDARELVADLRSHRREFVVGDDREHAFGVDRGDVGGVLAAVDDDVAR